MKRNLRVGTVIKVTVTKLGMNSQTKTLTVKAKKAPNVTTSCLSGGSNKPIACPV